jgi:hypothetical protein
MSEEIKRGDLVRDNDPRMPNRVLGVIGFDHKGRAIAATRDGRIKTRISLERIFTDGKARKYGFNRVEALR